MKRDTGVVRYVASLTYSMVKDVHGVVGGLVVLVDICLFIS